MCHGNSEIVIVFANRHDVNIFYLKITRGIGENVEILIVYFVFKEGGKVGANCVNIMRLVLIRSDLAAYFITITSCGVVKLDEITVIGGR